MTRKDVIGKRSEESRIILLTIGLTRWLITLNNRL